MSGRIRQIDAPGRTLPGEATSPRRARRGRSALIAAGLAAAALVAALVVLDEGERPEELVERFDGPPVTVGSAVARPWRALDSEIGTVREGWPTPMLARGTELCFGFGRVDRSPPRPSLARCVDVDELPELPANGLITVMTIKAGLDVWSVLAAGSEVESVAVGLRDREALGPDRVHLDGDVVVLRLPASAPVEALSWISGRTRYVCGDAAGSSAHSCVEARGASLGSGADGSQVGG